MFNLARGNELRRAGRMDEALLFYAEAAKVMPALASIASDNAARAKAELQAKDGEAHCINPAKTHQAGLKRGIFAEQMARIDMPAHEKRTLQEAMEQEAIPLRLLKRHLHHAGTQGPLVSIIMPTHNRAYVIAEAIESIQQQTYRHWQLEICDDGSTDQTLQVVDSLNDSRIRYRQLKKANGAVARNHGLRRNRGDIITFLDSDNVWHPDFLAATVGYLSRNPEALLVYAGYIDTEITGTRLQKAELKGRRIDYAALFERNFIDLNTIAVRRSLYEAAGGFDEALARQQDWELVLRYASRTRPHFIPLHLTLYRRNAAWSQVTIEQKDVDTRSRIQGRHRRFYAPFVRSRVKRPEELPRSQTLKRLVRIKISAPDKAAAPEWGDFHFANQLGVELSKLGWSFTVDCQDEWDRGPEEGMVSFVIRGRHRYPRSPRAALNLLWIISHPDRMPAGETDDYDHVFVASDVYADALSRTSRVPVSALHQATAPEHFHRSDERVYLSAPVLFVGNSRNEFRTMVRWAKEAGIPLSLWGTRWEQFVGTDRVAGEHIGNEVLHRYYSSCGVLLNDHWDSMRINGFISNRLFDASACTCPVITDPVLGLDRIFGDTILTASDAHDLKAKVEACLRDPETARQRAEAARERVLAGHTFAARAAEIVAKLEELITKHALRESGEPS
jgi:glycosyltransferase involved in cell wall biosynthesis